MGTGGGNYLAYVCIEVHMGDSVCYSEIEKCCETDRDVGMRTLEVNNKYESYRCKVRCNTHLDCLREVESSFRVKVTHLGLIRPYYENEAIERR
jgi:hypothetical protein